MKLFLDGFRNHQKLNLEFPKTGLVRISGRSGVGKSNIIHAIRWALYGKVNSVTPWTGKKGTTVRIKTEKFNVIRTRNPLTLLCNDDAGVTAQDTIVNLLGMSQDEFEISSYVGQGLRTSLINLTPSEQLDIMSTIAFNGVNPQKYRDQVVDYGKTVSNELQNTQRRIVVLEERQKGLVNNLEILAAQPFQNDIAWAKIEDRILEAEAEMKQASIDLSVAQKELKRLQDETTQEGRTAYEEARVILASAPVALTRIREDVTRYIESLPDIDFEQLNKEMDILKDRTTKLVARHKSLKQSQIGNQTSEELLATLQAEAAGILFSAGRLAPSESNLDETVNLIQQINNGCEKSIPLVNALRVTASADEQQRVRVEMVDINAQINSNLQSMNILKNTLSERDAIIAKIGHCRQEETRVNAQLGRAESIIMRSDFTTTLADLQLDITRQRLKTQDFQNTVTVMNSRIAHENNMLEKREAAALNKKMAATYKRQLADVTSELSALASTIAAKQSLATQTHALLKACNKATLETLESVIEDLNLRAAYWLDILLEGKVQAELRTIKDLKKGGGTVDSLNLQVTFDGQILTRLEENLSGGQYSRVVLAYQLGLADLYNSPVLLLDEACRGCDQETIDIILEALKSVAERRLIIMVEHNINSDLFDEVIQIG